MAVFNPSINDNQSSAYIGYSGGFGPAPREDTSLGDLFSQMGQSIGQVTEAVDANIKEDIYQQADASISGVRDLFGVEAATNEAGRRPDPTGPVPTEITRSGEYLNRLNQAYQNGTIRESYYYGKLNAEAKRLRTQFPGYEREVDQIFQSIAGVDPANAIVSSLRNEAEADARAAKSAEDRFYQYQKDNEEYIRRAYPNWQGIGDTSISPSQIYEAVSRVKANDGSVQASRARLGLAEDQNRLNHTDVVNTARNIASGRVVEVINGGLSSLGSDYKTLATNIQNALDSGQTPSPEQLQQMTNLGNKLKLNLEQVITQELMQPLNPDNPSSGSMWSNMTETERKDVINSGMSQVDNLISAITNGETGFVQANAAYIKAAQDQAGRQLLENNQTLATITAVRNLLGDPGYAIYLSNEKNLSALDQALSIAIQGKVDLGTSPGVNQDLTTLSNTQGVSPEVFPTMITNHVDRISNPEVSPDQAIASIKYLYQNKEGLDLSLFPEDQRATVYSRLVNPEVTARVQQLTQNNPDLWSNYKRWAYKGFVNQTKILANDIKSLSPETLQLFHINFNEDRGQIELTPLTREELVQRQSDLINSGKESGIGGAYSSQLDQAIQDHVLQNFRDLNLQLSSISTLLEADHRKASDILNVMGINIDNIISSSSPEGNQTTDPKQTPDILDDNPSQPWRDQPDNPMQVSPIAYHPSEDFHPSTRGFQLDQNAQVFSLPEGGDMGSVLRSAADELGIDPVDLATVMAYETGGSFDTSLWGGKGNRYMGLIQFGPEERRRYGAYEGQSFTDQVQAAVRFLKHRGLKPGMDINDLYSTINAGSPGRYNASDRPGYTVSKHVREMLNSRYRRMAEKIIGVQT